MWLFDLETFLVGEPDMARTIDKQSLDAANARFKAFVDLYKSHFGESPDDYTMQAYQSGNCYASQRQVNYWKGRLADNLVESESDDVVKARKANNDIDRCEIAIPMYEILAQADAAVYESIAGTKWVASNTRYTNANKKISPKRMELLKALAKVA